MELEKLRHELRHVRPAVEGHVAQLFEADGVDLLGLRHKAFVTGHVTWRDASHFAAHGFRIGAAGDGLAIVEAQCVERRERAQIDVVGHLAAAQRPEFFQQEWRSDDGGAGVEREAVLAEDVCPAAGGVEFLQYGYLVTAGAEADRRRQTAEPASDDDRVGPGLRNWVSGSGTCGMCQHKMTFKSVK